MRVFMGSAIAAVIAATGLFGAISQAVVISQYANSSTARQHAGFKAETLLAAREGGPAVYGWLYVRPAVLTTTNHLVQR